MSNLDGDVTIAPCLFQKTMRLVRNQRKIYLKQEIMHGKAWQENLFQVIQTTLDILILASKRFHTFGFIM